MRKRYTSILLEIQKSSSSRSNEIRPSSRATRSRSAIGSSCATMRSTSSWNFVTCRAISVAPLQWPRWAFLVDDLVAVRVAGERLAGVAVEQEHIAPTRALLLGMHARVVLVGRGGDRGELTRRHPTVHVDGAAIFPASACHYETSV